MSVKQAPLAEADLILYHRVAVQVEPPIKVPLPVVVWADTGAWAFQRARAGSAQFIALSAQWIGCTDAEKAELMHSALVWTYYADTNHKAPPASRVTPTTRREAWSDNLPEYLAEMYALMPKCEHCGNILHTNKPHKGCESYAAKTDARIAELERKIAEQRRLLAEAEAREAQHNG